MFINSDKSFSNTYLIIDAIKYGYFIQKRKYGQNIDDFLLI